MNATLVLQHYKQQLAQEIECWRADPQPFRPLKVSRWIAMSLMQKAIRRGRREFGLAATASLLAENPDLLWRRLLVIAFEDIGVADIDLIGLTVAASTGKTWRRQIGTPWEIASYLVSRMVASLKCRATDDLLYCAEEHPLLEQQRLELTFKPLPHLLDQSANADDIGEQALALWYAVGTHRARSDRLRERRGEPNIVFDFLSDRGVPDTIVEVSREGFRKTGEIICPFLIPLWQHAQNCELETEVDDLPPEQMIRGIPCWAFDVHVREGNQALARFMKANCKSVRWIRANVRGYSRTRFLGNLLFRVESGLVDRRLWWPVGDQLKHAGDFECLGVTPEQAKEATQLLRQDLPILNRERRHVFGSNL